MTPVLDAVRREELRKLAEAVHVHGWRCSFCNCQTFARCDELEQHGYAPGDDVRCVSCKHVSYWPRFNETADTTLALLAYMAELEAGLGSDYPQWMDDDDRLSDELHAELKRQAAFSIERHGIVALATAPFSRIVWAAARRALLPKASVREERG